jgi:hypothetical protein
MSSVLHPPAEVRVFESSEQERAHGEGDRTAENDPSRWVSRGIGLLSLLPILLGALKLAGIGGLAWGWVVSPFGIVLPVLFAGLLLMAE